MSKKFFTGMLRRIFFLFLLVSIAWNVFAIDSDFNVFQKLENEKDDLRFEIRTASVLPLRNLKEVFKFAPGFDLFFCLPVQKNTTVDIGFQAVFPVMPASFVYYLGDEAYDAKPVYQASVYLRYAYRHQLLANLSCKTYFGVGLSYLQTDLLKEENTNGDKVYYDMKAMDLHGGISLRYRQTGCFIEYHRAPYAIFNAKKIAYDFGGNFLNTGLIYYF
ncbi:MAG: hypothetical protein LBP72_05150 [Dysgonamonadaceae bacterium]|jgi:hypothetical protein|nr:hypothetical protein [Dysgonamonadaceae bacterium]